jgi:hypothetical protein
MRISDRSWYHSRCVLTLYARTFDPAVRLKLKDSKVWYALPSLKIAATAIGRTVYIPEFWTKNQVEQVLPHEVLGHVKQFRACAFGKNPVFGIPLMAIIYLLVFFPVLLAWGRYRLELHAFSAEAAFKLRSGVFRSKQALERADDLACQVSGQFYVFAIPRFWARWGFKRRALRIIKQCGF